MYWHAARPISPRVDAVSEETAPRGNAGASSGAEPGGRIAAVIPAFNEETVLEGTVKALVASGCALSDIYVVDDRSTDRTAELAVALGVQVYTVPVNGGKARAQVAGLEHFGLLSRYRWILFLDGDTLVDAQFMPQMRKAISVERPLVALYVGQVRSVRNSHVFSAQRAVEYAFGHDMIKQGQSNCNVILVSPGCASMYRSSVLKALHIDSSTLAEDMDLTIQVHRAGRTVHYVPQAVVHTQDPCTFRDYYKQILRWHRGFWQVVKKHGFFDWTRPKGRIDLYVIYLTLDVLLFNKVTVSAVIVATQPAYWGKIAAFDVGISLCVAGYAALRCRRWDVLYKFPVYYWLGFVNFFAFLAAMVDIMVAKRTMLNWNKVQRYDYDCHLTSTVES